MTSEQNALNKLQSLIERDIYTSAWTSTQSSKDWARFHVLNELAEFLELLGEEKPDRKDLVGDLLLTVLALITTAERDNEFTLQEVCEASYNKLAQRKPWVLKDEILPLEEEIEQYLQNKANG